MLFSLLAMSFFGQRAEGVGAPLNVHMFMPRNLAQHVQTLWREPRYFYDRVAVMLDQALHPSDPWLTRAAVNELSGYLQPTMRGFEWGSGRSTLWFARRLQDLVSVEHDSAWHRIVSGKLAAAGLSNVDYRLAAPTAPAGYARQIEAFPDDSFDFILIDGEERNACICAAAPKIRTGGWIVVDNADSGYDASPFARFECRRTSNGVWRTDLYVRTC
jgi:hypothetical protein